MRSRRRAVFSRRQADKHFLVVRQFFTGTAERTFVRSAASVGLGSDWAFAAPGVNDGRQPKQDIRARRSGHSAAREKDPEQFPRSGHSTLPDLPWQCCTLLKRQRSAGSCRCKVANRLRPSEPDRPHFCRSSHYLMPRCRIFEAATHTGHEGFSPARYRLVSLFQPTCCHSLPSNQTAPSDLLQQDSSFAPLGHVLRSAIIIQTGSIWLSSAYRRSAASSMTTAV